jgi:tRNA(Arg) A34 adenosine deaminase TadA
MKVSEFATLTSPPIEDGLRERHRLYSLLLMAILRSHMNGNKYGLAGDYGEWRRNQKLADLPSGEFLYGGGSYLGHNIAALAVDGDGRVIDFDFNHNEIFNSSVEHAESRLIRRLFSLTQIFDPWRVPRASSQIKGMGPIELGEGPRTFNLATSPSPMEEAMATGEPEFSRKSFGTMLTDVTLYTSLESCAQCSGIMCLADVREVVYLQYDNGQFYVGNIMHRATADPRHPFRSPFPLPADAFGFDYYDRLNAANEAFAQGVKQRPFFVGPYGPRGTPSVTSFLCTDGAVEIYQQATEEFAALSEVRSRSYRRPARAGQVPATSLTNEQVLAEVKTFYEYARIEGRRGTPHRV